MIDENAGSNTIGGTTAAAANVIAANQGDGIDILGGSSSNVIQGNNIGVDAAGDAAAGNSGSGIVISGASNNTVGGSAAGDANVISGNQEAGVLVSGVGTSGNVLEGNLIGTDVSGGFALGNASVGVEISDGATNNTIGGATAGSGNVISGNQSTGVYITGAGTTANLVTANLIGTNITGTAAIGNLYQGVLISGGAASNTIGGKAAGTGNIISGNRADGVDLVNSGTNMNLVAANIIGADITGGLPLGNGGAGVLISNGASQNNVGGATSASANIISGNFGDGIDITSDAMSDKVAGNHIGVNAAGTQAVPNGGSGIVINGANHISIGGAEPGQGNVISANNGIGVYIFGAGTIDNTVQGSLVGTDEIGTAALGNGKYGIEISDAASSNTVGGTAASKGNVISGNGSSGVLISGSGTTGNLVEGNLVGTNYLGAALLGNHNGGVVINGSATGNTVGGTAAGSRNVISGNNGDGIDADGSGTSQNLLEGNLIGTNILGTGPLGNTGAGVAISVGALRNTIGGSTSAAGNTISGNHGDGIDITDLGSSDLIDGNEIGLNMAGTAAVANGGSGIVISDATHNTIGGLTAGKRNLISGNGELGVYVFGPGTTANLIEGNYVGTDAGAHSAIGNESNGIEVSNGAAKNTIGGASAGSANVISGNRLSGVRITGTVTIDNLVEGNLIGTDITGTLSVGNSADGVRIDSGASHNTIGGSSAGARNIIAFNAANGVRVGLDALDAALANAILGNSIFSNSVLGIVVDNSAPGRAPVLSAAKVSGPHATITGTLSGISRTTFRVEFFSDPARTSQGKTYLGFVQVTTNAKGSGSFTFLASNLAAGLNVTATATDAAGNTSGFSRAVTVR
ncbi:MAG: beta strand repeat-containing protein [Isosphaeraceae bacterium]